MAAMPAKNRDSVAMFLFDLPADRLLFLMAMLTQISAKLSNIKPAA